MNKLRSLIQLICCFIVILFFIQAGDTMQEDNFWENYNTWYRWKKAQKLSNEQRKVILYLEEINLIFEEAENTWEVSKNQPNLPSPQKALEVVNKCINNLIKLEAPKQAMKYHRASSKVLNIIKKYHIKRLSTKNRDDLTKIALKAIPYESIRYSEYFNILRKYKMFDKLEEEMTHLGLLKKENLKEFYDYFQEVDIGTTPKCPKCFSDMRKVPIVYGEVKGDIYSENGQLNYLIGGEQNYPGRPEFGYICDKDNLWYEGYLDSKKDKITIRNWGWGLYSWKNKREAK